MDEGGDTYQEGARQVDEQRRGVVPTLPHLYDILHFAPTVGAWCDKYSRAENLQLSLKNRFQLFYR